ncbi:MAG: ABC transporter permease subunit [Streptomyces sp.]
MSSDTLAKATSASGIPEYADSLRILPRRRLGQWNVAEDHFTTDAVLRGLWLTLWLTAVVMTLGFLLGALLVAAQLSANPALRRVSWGYVRLFRSVPILVRHRGRVEAAQALGLGRWRRWWRILLPQAMRSIVSPAGKLTVPGVGRHYLEKRYARGSERTR